MTDTQTQNTNVHRERTLTSNKVFSLYFQEGRLHTRTIINMNLCSSCTSQLQIFVSVLTYLLTTWCRVILEKLTGLQLVKKFLAFHGTRRFITALTSVRHPSLSWVSPIQSIYPHPTSWRSILILSTHLA